MLKAKPCQQGLRPKASFLGLEAIDGLLLFPLFYVCTVLLGRMVLGILLTVTLAVVLRVIKWGRLPGYSSALLWFLVLEPYSLALGHDRAPPYPESLAQNGEPK